MGLTEVVLSAESLDRFEPFVGRAAIDEALAIANQLREASVSRRVWNVNSTAYGGGVAEMLRPLLSYARGTGIDTRWMVIDGPPEFFMVTKRLHNALHGERGDGSPLATAEHELYEATSRRNAGELLRLVRPNDIVLLHDPQTAGLAPYLLDAGCRVLWRCHIGRDSPNAETRLGWSFLLPYLRRVPLVVFSRRSYVPEGLESTQAEIVLPSIDPFSAKNQDLAPRTVEAILTHVGIITGRPEGARTFLRTDGSLGRVRHAADLALVGPAPDPRAPLIVQISRWDSLKDMTGVMLGFARLVETRRDRGAQLVLAGPDVHAVADDPDGARVFADVLGHWRALPHDVRGRIVLANLPMADAQENATIVNALQRQATIVVQKSLHEGFGLTVAEAMWKSRPVVASAVGGIQDQIVDRQNGLLLRDPTDLNAFADLLAWLLANPAEAERLGSNARDHVRSQFLAIRHLRHYGEILASLDEEAERRLTLRPIRIPPLDAQPAL